MQFHPVNIWNRIAKTGLPEHLSHRQKKSFILTNKIYLLVILQAALAFLLMAFKGLSYSSNDFITQFLPQILMMGFYLAALYLNIRGDHLFSRLLGVFYINFHILLVFLFYGYHVNARYFYFVAVWAPLVIVPSEHRAAIFSAMFLSLILFLSLEFSGEVLYPYRLIILNTESEQFWSHANTIFAIFMQVIMLVYFLNQTQDTEKDLEIESMNVKKRNALMRKDIDFAVKIQVRLLPQKILHLKIAGFYKPTSNLGGDFYDFIEFPETTKLGIFMSDVSGHGTQSAFLTFVIKSILLQESINRLDPASLLDYINSMLLRFGTRNFITIYYGIYDWKENTLLSSNAGHCFPLLVSQENIRPVDLISSLPCGIIPHDHLSRINKPYTNRLMKLPDSGKLFIFSDGISETCSSSDKNRLFEESEMHKALMENSYLKNPEEFLSRIYRIMIEFQGSEIFEDDLCMVCLTLENKN